MKCPPLVQEVVYNGILKKDRRSIHEKIARKIENMFADRLNPYYETLTFEYLLGRIHLQTALHGGYLSVGRCQQVDGKQADARNWRPARWSSQRWQSLPGRSARIADYGERPGKSALWSGLSAERIMLAKLALPVVNHLTKRSCRGSRRVMIPLAPQPCV